MGTDADQKTPLAMGPLLPDQIRKSNPSFQCHLKDLQPLLNYSPWNTFASTVCRLIQVCKESILAFGDSVGEGHVLFPIRYLESGVLIPDKDLEIRGLSLLVKTIAAIESIKKIKIKPAMVSQRKKKRISSQAMHDLLESKDKDSSF